jgi:hypothetical protein
MLTENPSSKDVGNLVQIDIHANYIMKSLSKSSLICTNKLCTSSTELMVLIYFADVFSIDKVSLYLYFATDREAFMTVHPVSFNLKL